MPIRFSNNALTLLAANLSAADTVVTVVPGTGAGFPAITGGAGDYYILTMENAAAQREFIRVNHRVGDTMGNGSFPCVRGYFGSTPRVWTAGDSVDLRWSADVVQDYLQTISGRYLGAFAAAPATDQFGGAVKNGDLYYDTTLVNLMVWNGVAWVSAIIFVEQYHPDGSVAAPGIAFQLEPSMGIYRQGIGRMDFAMGGNSRMALTAAALQVAPPTFLQSTLDVFGVTTLNAPGTALSVPSGNTSLLQLQVTGTTTLTGAVTCSNNLQVNGITNLAGSLGVGGGATFTGAVTINAAGTALNVPSGNINCAGLITATQLQINGNGTITGNGTISGVAFTGNVKASLGLGTPFTANAAVLYNTALLFTGPDASNLGIIRLQAANSAGVGGVVTPYSWAPGAALASGQHGFGALKGGGSLTIMGPGYDTGGAGPGATFLFRDGANANLSAIDFAYVGGSAGNYSTDIRFVISRNGVFNTAGDFIMRRAPTQNQPQLRIFGGWANTLALANMDQAPLHIIGSTNLFPAINLTDNVTGIWVIGMVNNTISMGAYNGPGPVGGYAFQLSQNGALSAGVYTNASDAELKTDITPISGALAAMLQLHGIRYKQTWDDAMMMGLTAQDVYPVFPELVGEVKGEDSKPPVKTLNYIGLIAPIIESLREIDKRLATLEAAPK